MLATLLTALVLLAVGPSHAETRRVSLQLPADEPLLVERLQSGWLPWLARQHGVELLIGGEQRGDVELLLRRLPADPATKELLHGLPVELSGDRFAVEGTWYGHPDLALAVRLIGRQHPSWLLIAANDDALAELAGTVVAQEVGASRRGRKDRFDLLLRENPWLERSGLWLHGEGGVHLDPATERNDFSARQRSRHGLATRSSPTLAVAGPATLLERSDVVAWLDRLDRSVVGMARRLPASLDRPLRLHFEPDYVRQGKHLGQIGPALLDAEGSVVAVFDPAEEDAARHALAKALLRRAGLEHAVPPWIAEGAALWLSGGWMGRTWADWVPRLAAAGVLPTTEELLSPRRQDDGSAVLWTPVGAAVIDALPGATLAEKLASKLDGNWVSRRLAQLAASPPPAPLSRRPQPQPFLRGVSLAMRNGLEVGYHAPSVDAELTRLVRIGANAVSLMPFAYQPDPRRPDLRYLNRSPSSETDTGVVHAARRAHARGLAVLWKPHIWVGHDSWSGDIEMADEPGWSQWWRRYRRFVLHHAALAEQAGAEQLSLGVELGRTVHREAEWRSLIRAARLLYSGELTYSGNWYDDWERAPFWDELDVLGIDAYFPLSSDPAATEANLLDAVRALSTRLRDAAHSKGRRVLLTEVGYAARRGAWVEPHQEGGEYSEEHQAIAYRALLRGLGQPSWLAGLYLWKAFSGDRGSDSGQSADFRFLGRRAEAEIGHYFSRGAEPDPQTGP